MKKITDIIGLDAKSSTEIAEQLNLLLSNYQVYYQNLRGFHWNILGNKFFALHNKFEELYDDAVEKIDEIAERILTIGGAPLHTFDDYSKTATIKPEKNLREAQATVQATLQNIGELIALERKILALASDAEDEGTAALMSDYISGQEKIVWLLYSFIQ